MQVAIYSKILSIVKALSSGTSEILHGGHKQWVDVLALRSSKEVVLCSVQLSKLVVPDSEKPGTAHARPACSSPTPRVYSNSCPLSWWCQPTISSSVVPFSSHHQSLPASGSFQMNQSLASGGQRLEFQLQHQSFQWTFRTDFSRIDWLDLLQSEGLSRVFSNTTVQKHQCFSSQLFLYSNSRIHTWQLEKKHRFN